MSWSRFSILCRFLFAALLLASAAGKAAAPDLAVHALAWSGLGTDARLAIVDVWSAWEALLGACLVAMSRYRAVHILATATSTALIVAHVVVVSNSDADCGCFGALHVPDWISFVGLGAGVIGSGCRLWNSQRGIAGVRRFAIAGAIALVAMAPALGRGVAASDPLTSLVEHARGRTGASLFVIGTWSCDHCRSAVEELRAVHQRSAARVDWSIIVVTRDSDPAPPAATVDDAWLEPLTVPEPVWWQLLEESPPTLVWLDGGARPVVMPYRSGAIAKLLEDR